MYEDLETNPITRTSAYYDKTMGAFAVWVLVALAGGFAVEGARIVRATPTLRWFGWGMSALACFAAVGVYWWGRRRPRDMIRIDGAGVHFTRRGRPNDFAWPDIARTKKIALRYGGGGVTSWGVMIQVKGRLYAPSDRADYVELEHFNETPEWFVEVVQAGLANWNRRANAEI